MIVIKMHTHQVNLFEWVLVCDVTCTFVVSFDRKWTQPHYMINHVTSNCKHKFANVHVQVFWLVYHLCTCTLFDGHTCRIHQKMVIAAGEPDISATYVHTS